jgi:alkylation response protein AidB-like acyl-CoA dehydrogenase
LILIDEIARCGYLGVIWALGCGNSIGGPPVITFGNEEQKQRFLPDMLSGKARFCLGVTEPDGKSPESCIIAMLMVLHSWIRRCWDHHHG